jgi:hypothetical protein
VRSTVSSNASIVSVALERVASTLDVFEAAGRVLVQRARDQGLVLTVNQISLPPNPPGRVEKK